MHTYYKRLISCVLVVSMLCGVSGNAFAVNFDSVEYVEEHSMFIPEEYVGIDLFTTGFCRENMTPEEEEYFDYLLTESVERNYTQNSSQDQESFKKDIEQLLRYNASTSSNISIMSDAPWWHLNTVEKIGAVLDVVISAALGGLGVASIRALIKQVGEAQAKKLVKSVVIDKIKSTLIRWGMTGGANAVEKYGLAVLFAAIDMSPGLAIAKLIDSIDAHKNNGYIDFW